MATKNYEHTVHLKHLIAAAWELNAFDVVGLANSACDAGEITVEEAQHLRGLADLLYGNRPASTMYRRASLKMQAWAAKEH